MIFRPARLSEVVSGRDNNLSLLRFLAASMVVYAHSFGLLGLTEREPFYRMFGKGLGDFGVDVFFVVSGLLITKSLLGKGSLGTFVWARVMRIFPALWITTLGCVFVAGLFFSPLDPVDFWSKASTRLYLLKNATMLPGFGAEVNLQHAFSQGGPEFNVPLWTLPHELQMYGLLAMCGLIGVLRHRWIILIMAIAGFAFMALHELGIQVPLDPTRARFVFFFFSGAACYLYRDRILLHGFTVTFCGLLLAAALIFATADIRRLTLAGLTPYLAIWFAYVPRGLIRRYNVVGDYSYGIYILAFPLQVLLLNNLPIRQPLVHFAVAMIVVLPLAILSWHLVENRVLHTPAPQLLHRVLKLKPVKELPPLCT